MVRMLEERQEGGKVCEGERAMDIRTCGSLGLERRGRGRFGP